MADDDPNVRSLDGEGGGGTRQTKTPAASYADSLRDLPANERPNTVAVVETQDGKLYYGRNSGGIINPQAQEALDQIGTNEFQGQCAEVNAISAALNDGANLKGARISVANVRGMNSATGVHGAFKEPCSTCSSLIDHFYLTIEGGVQ